MKTSFKLRTGDFTTNGQIAKLSAAALVVGAACAFIAVALLKSIYLVTNLSFFHRLSFAYATPTHNHLHAWVIVPPIVGALLIGLMARYGSEKIRGHGIPEAIEAMLINESKIAPRVALWKPISAALSIGTGGPFGAEGPIIMTGGSFGSLLSQTLRLSPIERRILLVAGAAGGMSATFAAPVSSVLFAVELLIFEFKPRSLVPIALASAVADAIRAVFLGPGPLFGMPSLPHVSWSLLGVSAVIGLVGSLLAVILTWAIYGVEDGFRKLPIHWMWWPALGAVVVGVGGWISPRALGVGYDSISAILNVRLGIGILVGLLVVKTVIWVVALGSGTSGGILAPILIIGGSLGGVAGDVLHAPHPGVWALLGMSAIFSGVTRTPFTSVIFPLELTHNLGALLPLLVAATMATGVSSWILPRSILTEKISRRGLHLTREYQADPLEMHLAREIAVQPAPCVPADSSVGATAQLLATSEGSPQWVSVQDDSEAWVGMVSSTRLFQHSLQQPNDPVSELVGQCPTIAAGATAAKALEAMIIAKAEWARVVASDGRSLGAVSLSQLATLRVRAYADETVRRRVWPRLRRS